MKKSKLLVVLLLVICLFEGNIYAQNKKSCCNNDRHSNENTASCCKKSNDIYSFVVKDINGKDVSLEKYKGRVLLIVNTASKCGLTPQYKGLEEIYLKYKDKGFEILAFPCNQFLAQEPGTSEEIQKFCSSTYNVTFPLFEKVDVNGEKETPLYTFLKRKAPFVGYPKGGEEFGTQIDAIHKKTKSGFDSGNAIRWNFGKFLISKDGQTILRYEPMVEPKDLEKDIERLLGEK